MALKHVSPQRHSVTLKLSGLEGFGFGRAHRVVIGLRDETVERIDGGAEGYSIDFLQTITDFKGDEIVENYLKLIDKLENEGRVNYEELFRQAVGKVREKYWYFYELGSVRIDSAFAA